MKTYLIRRGHAGPVKIGRSKNPSRRLADLQTAAAEPLVLVCVIDADVERLLHVACAKHQMQGEWFSGSAAFVADAATALDTVDANAAASVRRLLWVPMDDDERRDYERRRTSAIRSLPEAMRDVVRQLEVDRVAAFLFGGSK